MNEAETKAKQTTQERDQSQKAGVTCYYISKVPFKVSWRGDGVGMVKPDELQSYFKNLESS